MQVRARRSRSSHATFIGKVTSQVETQEITLKRATANPPTKGRAQKSQIRIGAKRVCLDGQSRVCLDG
jgi:hypothetical protein